MENKVTCNVCEGSGEVIIKKIDQECYLCQGSGKTPNQSRINWSVSADVECPKCGYDIDFMDGDEWWVYCDIGENKDFEQPEEYTCTECSHEFLLTGSDY